MSLMMKDWLRCSRIQPISHWVGTLNHAKALPCGCFKTCHRSISPEIGCNIDYFKKKPVNIPKITILLHSGYHLKFLTEKLQDIYPAIMTKIRFQLAPKPSRQKNKLQGKTGFIPQPTRWIIERSNAWMERCKSLVKNFDRTLHHATVRINLCFARLMLKRIAASSWDVKWVL